MLHYLTRRFDTLALQPPLAAPASTEAALHRRDPATWRQLAAWCHDGAGPGGSGWRSPSGLPRVDRRWAVAVLRDSDGAAPVASAWANAFARQLDGGTALDALPGRLPGLALRLRVKAADAAWWRTRRATDPWDAGWASAAPPALRQLQGAWMPRRATLLLAPAGNASDQAALALTLATLQQRSAEFRHPVRWLWVAAGNADTPLAAAAGLPCFRVVGA